MANTRQLVKLSELQCHLNSPKKQGTMMPGCAGRYLIGQLAGAAVLAATYANIATAQDAPFASYDAQSAQILNDAHDLDIGPDGRLYVADKLNGRVAILDPDSLELVGAFGDGSLPHVRDVSFGPDGLAYVAVTGTSSVEVYRITGNTAEKVRSLTGLPRVEGALAHSNGRIYAMASGVGQLLMLDQEGAIRATMPNLYGGHDVAEAPDGTIWVGTTRGALVHLDPDLRLLNVLDAAKFGFLGPRYLDFDELGRMVVADQDAHRFLLIDPSGPDGGSFLGVLGTGHPGMENGQFDDPEGIAILGNTYYLSDSDNGRIVRYRVVMN